MSLFITSDLHLNHYNIVLHTYRKKWIIPNPKYNPDKSYNFKFNNPKMVDIEAHDAALIDNWNSMVNKKDTVIIAGDFAWRDHNKYIHALNGRKTLVLGNHDKMSQDSYRNFSKVEKSRYQRIDGRPVMITHCPHDSWFTSCHGSWHLYGHCHGRKAETPDLLRFDVGVDVWDFKPVPWDIIVKKMTWKEELKRQWLETNPHRDNAVDICNALKDQNHKFIYEDEPNVPCTMSNRLPDIV